MTDEEAREEAERRWPDDGEIQHWIPQKGMPMKPCRVGRIRQVFHVLGDGDTWEKRSKLPKGDADCFPVT
jgi:hypothetical protein